MELALVMPAYNEEGCIAPVIRAWRNELLQHTASLKLIVVDDGSRDNTGKILDALAIEVPELIVIHQANGGHGAALRRGYDEALKLNPTWVFQVDSDDQFICNDFSLLWSRRGEANFILGRRLKRQDAFHRKVITQCLKLVNILLFGTYMADANVPFRLIRTTLLKELLDQIPSTVFAPNIFISLLAKHRGEGLQQIPVTHRDRVTGSVSIVRLSLIKACLRCLRELWHLRSQLRRSIS